MLGIPADVGRMFLTLLAKYGRIRGPAPPIQIEVNAGELSLTYATPEVTLTHRSATDRPDQRALVTPDLFEAHLTDGTPISSHEECHPLPDRPERWSSPGPTFLNALQACGRVTAREATRYALTRIQLRGSTGQVIAGDGRSALIMSGFTFPFDDDLLIPALPLFGSPILARENEVQIGRSARQVVLALGPWQVALTIDPDGRYPDVPRIIPKQATTVAGIADSDAEQLRSRLNSLLGADQEHRPVTIVLDGGVTLEGHDPATKQVERIRLVSSPSAGVLTRIVLDRRLLLRALSLGCFSLRVAPDQPLLFENGPITFLTLPLDQVLSTPIEHHRHPLRRTPVKVDMNHAEHREPGEPPDPLGEAEAIRSALADLLTRANRLVSQLKSRKKEQRALTQVWSSLKALNLGPEGRP